MNNADKLKSIGGRYSRGILKCLEIIEEQQIDDIKQILLFGSCARCEIRATSDIDIVVVTNKPFKDRIKRGSISGAFEWLPEDLEADVVFVDSVTLENDQRMLYNDIRTDGITLWKDGEYTDAYKQLLGNSQK